MQPVALAAALFISLIVGWTADAAERSVVEIWPGKVPDENGDIGAERIRMSPKLDRKQVEVTEQTRLITDVTKPTITIYRPAAEKNTGTAVVICPGGGYWDLYWQLEGEEVAAWLNSIGVTGIILKYRVPRRPDEPKASRRVGRSRMRNAPSAWSAAKLANGASIRNASASWDSRRGAISPSRRRRASTNEPTSRSMAWTKSVAGPTSPFRSIQVT
jgi:hypothetical protein